MSSKRTGIMRRRRLIKLAAFQDNLCFHCAEPLTLLEPDRQYLQHEGNESDVASFDHIVTRDNGGSNRQANQVVAHRGCNSKRGNTPPTDNELTRLAALNELRADVVADNVGAIAPGTFGEETPAARYLTDLLNRLDDKEGSRLREAITSRMGVFMLRVNALSSMNSVKAQRYFIQLLMEDTTRNAERMADPYRSLMLNVMRASIRRRFFDKDDSING